MLPAPFSTPQWSSSLNSGDPARNVPGQVFLRVPDLERTRPAPAGTFKVERSALVSRTRPRRRQRSVLPYPESGRKLSTFGYFLAQESAGLDPALEQLDVHQFSVKGIPK